MEYNDSPLGKKMGVSEHVDPSTLYFIERDKSKVRGIEDFAQIKLRGEDIWNCYEFSWLAKTGIPSAGVCRIRYESNSKFIVESKSLKLYLASFYNTTFVSSSHVEETIYNELNKHLMAATLTVSVISLKDEERYSVINSTGRAYCLDWLENFSPELALEPDRETEDYVCSHVFRSLCPVTAQPDWATVEIHYKGRAVDRGSLLGYLISFRNHAAFHEEVCEQIYYDLYKLTEPSFLFVRCNFLRRGGIDINPVRYSKGYNYNPMPTRLLRQ